MMENIFPSTKELPNDVSRIAPRTCASLISLTIGHNGDNSCQLPLKYEGHLIITMSLHNRFAKSFHLVVGF